MDCANALKSLSRSKNPTLAALAQDLLNTQDPQSVIEKQAALIKSLKAQVEALEQRLERRDTPMSGQQLEDLKEFMTANLLTMPVPIMVLTFTHEYFDGHLPSAREVIAECLLQECSNRNVRPQPLWSLLVTQRGAM